MSKRLAFFPAFLLYLLAITFFAVSAQTEFENMQAEYQFGETIHFSADFYTPTPIEYGLIYFQEKGKQRTTVKPVEITALAPDKFRLSFEHNLSEHPFRAFSKMEYRFEIGLQSDQVAASPTKEIEYIDNRFQWQTMSEDNFRVFWYEGDIQMGQNALDVAQTGLERINAIFPGATRESVDIYIYPNARDMQNTLLVSGQSWIAGHADPDLGIIAVSLPRGPEQQLLTEQRIPHELMHVMLYQVYGDGYENLPVWFSEGLATVSELFPNPDYEIILGTNYTNNTLSPLSTLCKSFPNEAAGALAAYAKAASITNFVKEHYGSDTLKLLADQYSSGIDCENGINNTLGISIDELERQWTTTHFGNTATQTALTELAPWLVLFAAVMIAPVGLFIAWLRHRRVKDAG